MSRPRSSWPRGRRWSGWTQEEGVGRALRQRRPGVATLRRARAGQRPRLPDPKLGKAIPDGVDALGAMAAGSVSGSTTIARRSRSRRCGAGGSRSAGPPTRGRSGCWSPLMLVVPTATGSGRGRPSWPGLRPRRGCRSRSATSLAALLLVGQTLGRQILLEATESPILRALGMTRVQLIEVAMVRAAPIAVAGAVLAAAGAVALSPATPLGVARRAELDTGVAVDLPVLAVGAVAVTAGVLACAAVAGWRAARAPAGQLGVTEAARVVRPSRVGTMLAATGLPPTAVTGTRLALEPGQGRTAVPIRSAIAVTAAGVCALTVAVTFSAGLRQLLGDQRAYGVTWDVQVGNFADAGGSEQAARTLAANPTVAAYAGGVTGSPDRSSTAGRCRCCRSRPARDRWRRPSLRAARQPNPMSSRSAVSPCVSSASGSATRSWQRLPPPRSGFGSWAR